MRKTELKMSKTRESAAKHALPSPDILIAHHMRPAASLCLNSPQLLSSSRVSSMRSRSRMSTSATSQAPSRDPADIVEARARPLEGSTWTDRSGMPSYLNSAAPPAWGQRPTINDSLSSEHAAIPYWVIKAPGTYDSTSQRWNICEIQEARRTAWDESFAVAHVRSLFPSTRLAPCPPTRHIPLSQELDGNPVVNGVRHLPNGRRRHIGGTGADSYNFIDNLRLGIIQVTSEESVKALDEREAENRLQKFQKILKDSHIRWAFDRWGSWRQWLGGAGRRRVKKGSR